MKIFVSCCIAVLLFSCTSNTIFEKPKDLIPKDTMQLLIQDMWIASSASYIKNVRQEKNIKYMAFVYDKYKIDSIRFQKSNLYYVSNVDMYLEIIENAKHSLSEKKKFYTNLEMRLDSLERDSLDRIEYDKFKLDSIKKDSLKNKKDVVSKKN
ncbi:DUF4296 domain-containing protein [Polaribacter sp. WD7]|uniref:DUF4296 domain-containing protein n=1 Tax=Polaribacter sp. WD7 TaxID=2269061 RepID=UPI000DF471E9|nr:DUF4296 domain-containing protein [Polaribacter sp. WD7]RCS28338.1 DUF4296 domain-containing protein [Polaribacter sp. WD7]